MATIKLTISRYTTKQITTTKGEATVFNFNGGGKWYNGFVGKWNKDWKDGVTIEVAESQINTTERNGKKYLNINAPPKAAQGAPGANPEDIKRILKALEIIYKDLQEIKAALFIVQKDAPKTH